MVLLRTARHGRAAGGGAGPGAGWAAAARVERRLQATQVAIVVALSLIVVAVAAITGRSMISELADYRVEQSWQTRLNTVRYALQEQEATLWRQRSRGEAAIRLDAVRVVLGAAAEGHALADKELASDPSPAERRAIRDTLAGLDTLVAVVAGPREVGPAGSPADLRFLARLEPIVTDLKNSADRWSAENAAELTASNAGVTAATRRIIALTGATALLATIIGLLLWRRISRARRRIIHALREAQEQLRHLANTDPLTGLANQRVLHDRLQRFRPGAGAEASRLSVIMIDLDHFKVVNDTHGHPVGDQVLLETAGRMMTVARRKDVVARIGGEEFLMLLPDTDGAAALALAERVRAAVRDSDYPGGVGRLTASLGVATMRPGLDADALLRQADAALYWAKSHGRDSAFAYSDELMSDLSAQSRARQIAHSEGLAALRALALAIDAKDPATRRHSIRVAEMAVLIARELGWTPEQLARLREAGLVHDVGKIGVPDAILLKPGILTPDERELMMDHARLSSRIVSEVLDADQVEWVASHHERWDGDGYPDGLSEEDIPEGARILALADCWDAMTGARGYNAPLTTREALEECQRCSQTHFWPAAVAALERLHRVGDIPTRQEEALATIG